MKNKFKVIFSFLMLLLVTLTLVACNTQTKKDEEAVKTAKESLVIGFTSPDTATSVTKNLTLKAKEGEVDVTWKSNNEAVIKNNGEVVRPDADTQVTVTATLKKGDASDTKPFTLTVKAKEVVIDPDIAIVEAAKNALEIEFAAGDNKDGVTKNVVLPTAKNGVVITWASDKTQFVSVAGVVTRPEASKEGSDDETVVLTATLTKGVVTETKKFTVVVLAEEYVATGKELIVEHYKDSLGKPEWKATEDVQLVATVGEYSVVWVVVEGSDFFSNTGVVTRPTFTQGDQTIHLRADLSDQTSHTFYFQVEKLAQTDAEKVEAALTQVTVKQVFPSGYQEINFSTPATVKIGEEDIAVTWVSSDTNVMTNAGELVSFEDAEFKEVTLTATITYKGITSDRIVEFKVLGVLTFDSFDKALVIDNFVVVSGTVNGRKVKVTDVSLYKTITDGYYLASSDNRLAFVYGTKPDTVLANKVYDVIFNVDVYYGTYQIKNVSLSNERDGDQPVITPEEVELEDIVGLTKPSNTTPNHHTLYTLKNVEVRIDPSKEPNYNTFLVPIGLAADEPLTDQNSIMIYYKSNLDVIKTLDGKKIASIQVINNGYRTNNIVWNVNFIGKVTDIELILTDEESVATVFAGIDSSINYTYYKDTTLTIVEAQLGASVVWTSSHPDIIPVSGDNKGVIVLPATQTEVTLTAVVTKNDATETFTRKVLVGPLADSTVAEVEAETIIGKKSFKVTGIVTGIAANRTYTFEDETGAFVIYALSSAKFEIGKSYTIVGTKDVYQGLIQLRQVEAAVAGDDGVMPTPVVLDEAALKADLSQYQGRLISIENAKVTELAVDNYGNVSMTLTVGEAVIKFKWDSRVLVSFEAKANILLVKKDDVIQIVGAPLGWASNAALIGYNAEAQIVRSVPATDQEKVDEAAQFINVPSEITDATALVLPVAGKHGATIAWTSSNPDVISTTGEVKLPLLTTQVTLTAKVTLNEAVKDVEFKVNVKVGDAITVAMARESEKGTEVKITGIVTGIAGTKYVFVSDADGTTIVLYNATLAANLAVGDLVLVAGKIDIYSGLVQLASATMEIISSENTLPEVIELNGEIPTLVAADQGKRYTINGLWVVSVSGQNLVLTDGTNQITARVDDKNAADLIAHIATAENKKVNLFKVHVGWFNGAQLFLFKNDDVIVEELTDADKQQLAKLALVKEFDEKTFKMDTAVTLAETGLHGAAIVWAMNPVDAVADGKWKVVTADTDVVLTATITVGELAAIQVELNVTIEFVDPDAPQAVEVTMTSPANSGNMDETSNYAAAFGLDENIFTVKAVKNSASLVIGTYADFRIYGDRNSGNGNELVITIAAGYKITKIDFVFGGSTNSATGSLTFDAGTAILLGVDDVKSVTKSYSDLSANLVTLKNTHTGGDKNGQIRILSVVITYVAVK